MRQSLRNFQPVRTTRITGSRLVTFAIVLLLLGSIFSLSAFTLAPSTLDHASSRGAVANIPEAGCFPGNAYWTWVSPDRVFQAWMALDLTPSKHVNYHVQRYCGSDIANYHITYNGSGIWKSYDSVSNTTAYYGDSHIALCDSLSVAVSDQATAAGKKVYQSDSESLVNSSISPLAEGMDSLIGGACADEAGLKIP